MILKDKFERLKKPGILKPPTDETALVGNKKFARNCRYGEKRGHKTDDCFKKQAEKKTRVVEVRVRKDSTEHVTIVTRKGIRESIVINFRTKPRKQKKKTELWC
jgi:hypothetical protein